MRSLFKTLLLISMSFFPVITVANSSATIETHLTINAQGVNYIPIKIYYVSITDLTRIQYYLSRNFKHEHIIIPPKEGYFIQMGDIDSGGTSFSMYGCNNLAQIMSNEKIVGILIDYWWKTPDTFRVQCSGLNRPVPQF